MFGEGADLTGAREKVTRATTNYSTSVTSLNATLGAQSLFNERDRDIQEWVLAGDIGWVKKQAVLLEKRVYKSGTWFLELSQVRDWMQFNEGLPVLIGHGIGMSIILERY